MTRYGRSRASGYPPDLMPFSARRCVPTSSATRAAVRRARRPPPLLSEQGKSHEVGRVAKRTDNTRHVTRERNGQQRRRARPRDEAKLLAIVRTIAIRSFARSRAIERNDLLEIRNGRVLGNREIKPYDRRAGARPDMIDRTVCPGRRTLPPCSPPSRSSPPGASGNLDRGCARRRTSSMGRDGRMASGPNKRMRIACNGVRLI